METEKVTLENLAGGEAADRFNYALQKTVENILDPNTNPIKPRTITMKVTLKANHRREVGETLIVITPGILPDAPLSALLYLGKDASGQAAAYQSKPKQMEMFPDKQTDGVTRLDERRNGHAG